MAFHHPGPGSASGSASSSSSGFHFLNSPFGDTTYTKVFVGGLAWETKSETLRRHFEQFGEILEAVVITDKNTGRSKGYGFVTFRDPDSARRACADPSPVIDGRRANCNLASLGRPHPALPFGVRPRSVVPFTGGVSVQQGPYVGSPTHQQSVPFSYQQGFPYSPYSYNPYGMDYMYQQNVYNPYTGNHYFQVYGFPGAVNPAVYPVGQFGQPIPGGPGYMAVQGYSMPAHQIVQLSGPNVNGITGTPRPLIQAPYPAGLAATVPAQPHFIVPAHTPQFVQGSGSDQTTESSVTDASILQVVLVVVSRKSIKLLQWRELKAWEHRVLFSALLSVNYLALLEVKSCDCWWSKNRLIPRFVYPICNIRKWNVGCQSWSLTTQQAKLMFPWDPNDSITNLGECYPGPSKSSSSV
ncbi:hypothetical protein Cni_G21138 [Canna indica]|uniref:RRM domain-containing protein n=1 Tax=Canna indica TaxID=4628 RepID=A0AAQ3KNY8_9LILI|nr:hypothetical protein Cni_G21138 [Canna indica]